jgi:hypothetical protein
VNSFIPVAGVALSLIGVGLVALLLAAHEVNVAQECIDERAEVWPVPNLRVVTPLYDQERAL